MERQTLHLWRQKTEKETASLTIKIHKVNQIRHFKNKEGTEAEMYPAIVFGIVPGDAPVSSWTIFFSMYLVTVPKDPAKNNSHRFPLVCKVAIGKLGTPRRRRQREGQKSNKLNKEKNTELCRCIVLFLYIFLPSLLDYDGNMPNFTFYGRRKQATANFPSLSDLEYGS